MEQFKASPGEGYPKNIAKDSYVVCGSESGIIRTRTMFQPLWCRGLNMIQAGEFTDISLFNLERYNLDDLVGTEMDFETTNLVYSC